MDFLWKFFFCFKICKIVVIVDELNRISIEGLFGFVVDYMVCLLFDIFMFIFEGFSNFVNNLLGY